MPAALRWFLQLGPTNPIVVRLVQGGSRRMRHFYIRTIYLFVVMVVLLVLLFPRHAAMNYKELALTASNAFQIVAYLQIALICILAPVFMAGAIAQESNPRTWDIVLTTPLSAAQIVLGHLFGRLFFVLALLFASLPFFALTQYFGGVPGSAILMTYAVSAAAALLVGAIAVSLAVNRLAGRRAVFGYCVSMVSYIAVTWAVDLLIRPSTGGVTLLTPLNPFLALLSLLDPTGYPRPDAVVLGEMSGLGRLWFGNPALAWCLLSTLLSFSLLALSTLTARRIGNEGRAPWFRRSLRSAAKGEKHRAPRSVWHNPIAWREAAARQATPAKIIARWSFIGAGALWAIGLIAYYHGGALSTTDFRFALLATVWTELIVVALIAVNVSATAVSKEREDGTLDLLLTTPITPGAYISGKLRGLISYLAPLLAIPVGTLALAGLYVLIGGFDRAGGVSQQELVAGTATSITSPAVLPEAAILLPIVALPFIAFCVMVGLHWSLKSKGTIGSVVASVSVVGGIAGIIGICGWQAGQGVPYIGPILAAINPLTLVYAAVNPAEALAAPIGTSGAFVPTRISLGAGTIIAVGLYSAVVYGIHANMVRTFDTTVRRLAGTR